MIVNYTAHYEIGSRPSIRKSIEASDGSAIFTNLNYSNEDERDNVSDETVVQHITNLHLYMKELTNASTLIPVGDPPMSEVVPEWNSIQSVYYELVNWWVLVSFKPEPEGEEESDHYHDPDTGEHVPAPEEEVTP